MRRLLRIQKITIEATTEDSDVWVHVVAQEVIKDDAGDTIQVIPSDHFDHFRLRDIALEMFNFKDPVTQHDCIVSGAGAGTVVETVCKIALQKKFGGTLEDNELWLS